MCAWFGWNKEQRNLVYESFHRAVILQFNASYGEDDNNLASWQLLCLVLRIQPIPDSLKTCRKVRMILLFDTGFLIHTYILEQFPESLGDLRQYLRSFGFPRARPPSHVPHRSGT